MLTRTHATISLRDSESHVHVFFASVNGRIVATMTLS